MLADKEGVSREAIVAKLRTWYNGCRFTTEDVLVYSPVSVMNCLDEGRFSKYWFETGAPSFFIDLLEAGDHDLPTGCFIRWFTVSHSDGSPFWSAVAERSGDTALAFEQSAIAATLSGRAP